MVAPTRFTAKLDEPAVAGDPTSSQKTEQLPTYNAYSIDGDVTGAAGLRQLRPARGLRGARAPRHLREGRDRDRALRRVVARHQAQGRGRARRGRLPHLLRSARRRLLRRATSFPTGPMRTERRRAARQRDGHAALSRRSADARASAPTPDAKRLDAQGRADAHEDSRCCRSPTATRSRCWRRSSGPVAPAAWRGALPITYHVGPGPAQVHLKLAFNWDIKPLYDVIARIPGCDVPDEWIIRGNHHDAWVNGADDPVSGMVALTGRGARARRAAEAGLAAEAHDRLLRVGRRGAGAARLDRVGRGARRRAARSTPSSTSTPTATAAASSTRSGSHSLEQFVNGVARDVERSRRRSISVWKRAPGRTRSPSGAPDDAHGGARRARTCASARSARAPTTRRSSTPRHRLAQPRLRRRGRRRHLPLDLRRLLLVHALLRHRLRLRPRAGADRRHGGDAPGRRRRAAVRVHESRRHGADVRDTSCRSCSRQKQDDDPRAEPADRAKACSRRCAIRGGRMPCAEAGGRAAGAQFRAARERRRPRSPRARSRYERGARGRAREARGQHRGARARSTRSCMQSRAQLHRRRRPARARPGTGTCCTRRASTPATA